MDNYTITYSRTPGCSATGCSAAASSAAASSGKPALKVPSSATCMALTLGGLSFVENRSGLLRCRRRNKCRRLGLVSRIHNDPILVMFDDQILSMAPHTVHGPRPSTYLPIPSSSFFFSMAFTVLHSSNAPLRTGAGGQQSLCFSSRRKRICLSSWGSPKMKPVRSNFNSAIQAAGLCGTRNVCASLRAF